MFGNMAAYTLTVASWRDDAGKLWEPNTTVTLIAPGAMV
jgi:prophage tail gpP-like protein